MEARLIRHAVLAGLLLVSMGASYRSANFVVETADPQMAARISQAAEHFRHDLAIDWVGQAMPNWAQPCMMTVQVAPHLGAGGATTFVFDNGEVFGWRMTIQGSAERVLDSVLPHEITHMVFASYFRRPLPRWADEGGATSVEHISEKQKHRQMLMQFLHTGRGIAFGQMFAMTEYPQDVMPLYAQGYSLAEFLIDRGGRRKFVDFLSDGMRDGQWPEAVARNYQISDLSALQNTWVAWVSQGFPMHASPPNSVIAASAQAPARIVPVAATGQQRLVRPEPNLIYRIPARQAVDPAPQTTGGEQIRALPAPAALPPSQDAAPNAPTTSAVESSPAQTLPAQGWRTTSGAPTDGLAAPSTPATVSQVARPPAMEPSRQVILEWQQHP